MRPKNLSDDEMHNSVFSNKTFVFVFQILHLYICMNPLACHAFQNYSHLIDDEMYNSLFSNKNRVHCSIYLLIGGLDSKTSGVHCVLF